MSPEKLANRLLMMQNVAISVPETAVEQCFGEVEDEQIPEVLEKMGDRLINVGRNYITRAKEFRASLGLGVVQSQRSTDEQLRSLVSIANRNGLYDAADFIANFLESKNAL